ncbi:spore coat protein U domain-containing protein [Pararhizobium sp. LjRoot255]|uniref:spore coat protein U domain-containing protein n=1 Tax=Pararhizobium sp. LjRoot255 TaxID=3342298 RepID=UPI003F4FD8FD
MRNCHTACRRLQSPRRSRRPTTYDGGSYSGTGTGVAQSVPVYGRVPAPTTPTQGLYSDTIVATVTY